MIGNLFRYRDRYFPVRFAVGLCSYGQPVSLKLAGTGIAKNVHFDPLFTRLIDI